MSIAQSFTGFVLFVTYLAVGLGLLVAFTRAYLWLTPYNEAEDIAAGKLAPAIALVGAMLGFTFPLLVASYTQTSLPGYIAWSALACLVQLSVYWVMYRLLPRVIESNNSAGATCYAGASLCAGLINAASFIP